MDLQLNLFRPLLEEYARMTAKMMVAELKDNPIIKPRYTDTAGAATYLGMTETALAQRKSKGQVPESCYTKVGNSLIWDLEGIDAWMVDQRDAA